MQMENIENDEINEIDENDEINENIENIENKGNIENDSDGLVSLVDHIVRALVDDMGNIDVSSVKSDQSEIIQIRVSEDDRGKVIGKSGRIAKSIRTIVRAAAVKEGKRTLVEIVD